MLALNALCHRHLTTPRTATFRLQRAYATTQLSNGITLAYDLHEPPKDAKKSSTDDGAAILFIHGLFGSKANNRGMSK